MVTLEVLDRGFVYLGGILRFSGICKQNHVRVVESGMEIFYCFGRVLRIFLSFSFFWSGHQGPKAYSLWGGVIPSPIIGYDYL